MIKPFKKLVHLGKVHMMPRESFSLAQQKILGGGEASAMVLGRGTKT